MGNIIPRVASQSSFMTQTITIEIPDRSYQRLVQMAEGMQKPFNDIILRALEIGSPPDWIDVPEEFQADIAALDRLDDDRLRNIARSQRKPEKTVRYNDLLARDREEKLAHEEQLELTALRKEIDLFMLQKAQASVLLRWRGHRLIDLE
jgi:hypothetical protein